MNLTHKSLFFLIVAFLAVGMMVSTIDFTAQAHEVALQDEPDTEEDLIIHYPFQITSRDTLDVVSNKIRRNETIYSILRQYQLSTAEIKAITDIAKPVFDVRSIGIGKTYHVFRSNDSTATPRHFVYERNLRDYVVLHFGDSLYVETGTKPIETKLRKVAGVVDQSLYLTLVEQDVNPQLADMLAQAFAWQIDFYRVKRGDAFKVIFEEHYIDDQLVGVGEVKAASFMHGGETFHAISFTQDDETTHYDLDGNSLKKAFLKAPLTYSRVSSRFTNRRYHPVLKKYMAHMGTDYVAPHGTPVHAVGDGDVTIATYGKNNGFYVKIRHNSTYSTQYLHLSRIANGVKYGQKVTQGQVIGYVGNTGLAAGVHLCYRLWKNGIQVDPFKEVIPSINPVKPENRGDFELVKSHWLRELNSIPDLWELDEDIVFSHALI